MAGDFFLDADDAKSLGNTEYMRKPTKTRRTFPNTAASQGLEIVQEVSSLNMRVIKSENGRVSSQSESSSNSTNGFDAASTNGATAPQESQSRRKTDTSLDMFRSMARDMRR